MFARIFFQSSAFVLMASMVIHTVSAQTLDDILDKTLSEHPQVVASLNQYRAQLENVDVARGGWFPTLDVTAGVGKQHKEYAKDGAAAEEMTVTRKETSFSLKQNLFSGFNTSGSVEQALHKTSAEYLRLHNTLQEVAFNVADAYLKVLEQRDQVQLAEENLDVHNDIHQQIAQRAKQGVARNSDLSQIDGRLALAHSEVITARNNLTDAESEFYSVTGMMPEYLEQPDLSHIIMHDSIQSARQVALDLNPGILASEQDIKAAESQYMATKSAYWPTIDVEIDQSWRHNADGITGHDRNATAVVRTRYNLFRGGSDRARVQESAYRAEESRARRDRSLRSVDKSLRVAWASYEFLGEQKQYLEQHKASSKETVKAYREQFNIGKRTLLDLLDSENELFRASKSLSRLEYQEKLSLYRIGRATGELLELVKYEVPVEWQGD